MNIQRWIARREPNWKRLDALLRQVEKTGLKSLRAGEIRDLASLYRSVAADLARARTQQVGNILVQNLQSLTTRGYNQIYQSFAATGMAGSGGVLPLGAIFLAGGAGLLLARAILFPGKYRRASALQLYGSQAVQLVYGIVPMLIIAGTIEGFFSPNPLVPEPLKYLVGMGLLALLVIYCQRKRV